MVVKQDELITKKLSYQTSPQPKFSGSGPRVGLTGYAGLLDPPRNRPFIKAYNLSGFNSGLRYFRYSQQLLQEHKPQESDKYDDSLQNAQHYARYLARLMLNLRRQRGLSAFQVGLHGYRWLSHARQLYRSYSSFRTMQYLIRQGYSFYNRKYRFDEPWQPGMPRPPGYTPAYTPPWNRTTIIPPRLQPPWEPPYLPPVPTPPYRPPSRRTWRWRWPRSPDFPDPPQTIRGGRWILIRIVQKKTFRKKIWLHTKTKEVRTTYVPTNRQSLRRRQQLVRRRYGYRNKYDTGYRYRRRFKPQYAYSRW